VRPLTAQGAPYNRCSRALRDLAGPKLLDNRVSYRLREVSWTEGAGSLGFSYTSYFDVLDVGEAAAHEFTDAWLRNGRKRPSMADLRLRRHITDPFDLSARPMPPSINTLTIRRDPIYGHRMYLHQRDAAATAVAGGMYHVVPAGVFQPSSLAPAHQANDFSLWRNIQREFSEELLGSGPDTAWTSCTGSVRSASLGRRTASGSASPACWSTLLAARRWLRFRYVLGTDRRGSPGRTGCHR
jgi:hypothetical protein